MKRFATFLLLTTISLALTMPLLAEPQRENTRIGENAREAKKAAKDQQKINKRIARKQRKAMKNYQKAQRRAAKQQKRRTK
jgi:hypothetical protein